MEAVEIPKVGGCEAGTLEPESFLKAQRRVAKTL